MQIRYAETAYIRCRITLALRFPPAAILFCNSRLPLRADARQWASLRGRPGCGRRATPGDNPGRISVIFRPRGSVARGRRSPGLPPRRAKLHPPRRWCGWPAGLEPPRNASPAARGLPLRGARPSRCLLPPAEGRDPQATQRERRYGGRCGPIAGPTDAPGNLPLSAAPGRRQARRSGRSGRGSSQRSAGSAPGK